MLSYPIMVHGPVLLLTALLGEQSPRDGQYDVALAAWIYDGPNP
jgi:hypothetical protein